MWDYLGQYVCIVIVCDNLFNLDSSLFNDISNEMKSDINMCGALMKSLITEAFVLVVESVTKARVIQGYLGDMFEVLPSYGHVRDLAARSGSVRPDDDFSMVWEVPSAAWTHLKSIKVALSGDVTATGCLHDDINVTRVVFNEITESSIKASLQSPREIDANLVHAYLARRALDYLIGFNISPLLWRKLPSCQSAGRVQSDALSLICDREMEIDGFKPQEATGLITYIRTDGLHISDKATKDIQSYISERYGQNFASKNGHNYFKKVKNAQEAHEAIRPTDIRRLPSKLVGVLYEDALKLYKLIWSRTMACQMEPATIEQIQVDIGKPDQSIIFRSSSSKVQFPGYQAIYEDVETNSMRDNENGRDDRSEVFEAFRNLTVGDPMYLGKVKLEQH
ncbi:hypothetical protein KY290_012212 [Solanum tuberosum]|uniref:DNA topoisomerase n=1 Tax=Solanum tuberosum TaxID=4113 RepID=A0ABQ7W2W8_SOLTU|nr:hypothetical protein KY290_012212 [Solanum tuberosum]